MLYLSGVIRSDMPAMVSPVGHRVPPPGQPWAVDNGRFSRPEQYIDAGYLAWLRTLPYQDRCLFATAPDVVGDAAATLELSLPMLPRIRALGLPAAFVGQDGLTIDTTPWDAFDALFIGGTTEWKLSEVAYQLAAEAKRRGKWTHMGRVNSWRRFRAAAAAGYDSADGTYLRFDPTQKRIRGRPIESWTGHVLAQKGLGL
jgi:hypothetical protein